MWLGRQRRLLELRSLWGAPISRERKLDAITASHASRVKALGARALDDRTWADLDLDKVFEAVDRTTSTLGQHALYHRLRTAPVGDHLEEFNALVERMSSDSATRERAQLALGQLSDPHGYDVWWLGDPDALDRRPWYRLFPVLTTASIALGITAVFWHAAILPLVAVLVLNIVIRYATDKRTMAISRGFRQLAPLIATAQALRFVDDGRCPSLIGALMRDVPSLARVKLISRWTNGNPFMVSLESHWLAIAANDVVEAGYEYLNLAFLLDATGVHFALKDLATHRAALLRVVAAIGEVDAAIAVASFRHGAATWTRPAFGPAASASTLNDIRHPLLDAPVPNSVVMHPGKGLLVTGSNMSGKSTLLRTVGVNAVLSQTICTALASSYSAPVFVVRSCIGRSDDLIGGKSYYLAEVQSLLSLVEASRQESVCLFLLDEMFRGTNASERIAAGEAVLREFLVNAGQRTSHVAIAATHDLELVDLLADIYESWHFGDSLGPDGLVFNYRLTFGPATTRNAIALLGLNGAPTSLVERASETADRLDRERGVTVIRR